MEIVNLYTGRTDSGEKIDIPYTFVIKAPRTARNARCDSLNRGVADIERAVIIHVIAGGICGGRIVYAEFIGIAGTPTYYLVACVFGRFVEDYLRRDDESAAHHFFFFGNDVATVVHPEYHRIR